MIIYILFSFVVGLEGGMFELKGNDIVSSSFGPSFGIFGDLSATPNLNYSLSFGIGKTDASTQTFGMRLVPVVDTTTNDTTFTQLVDSMAQGEKFECLYGNLSVNWFPFKASLSPYLIGRLGLKQWKIISGGNVIQSLGYPDPESPDEIIRNDYQGLSLSIGGGAGMKAEIAGFVVSVEGYSDFIFSEDKAWDKGFGMYDDNEWTLDVIFKLGREF